jgi:hypothetical protein
LQKFYISKDGNGIEGILREKLRKHMCLKDVLFSGSDG